MRRALLVCAVLALVPFAPLGERSAHPCGNAVYLDTDEATRLVARGERALKAGQFRRALAILEPEDVVLPSRALERRRALLAATATLRLGDPDSAADRFATLFRRDPEDPVVRTRLAESLAQMAWLRDLPRARQRLAAKALELLDDLERRDLVVDAEGYRALGELRDFAGDRVGRDRAQARCRSLAAEPGRCARGAPPLREGAPGS